MHYARINQQGDEQKDTRQYELLDDKQVGENVDIHNMANQKYNQYCSFKKVKIFLKFQSFKHRAKKRMKIISQASP